jgi:uncharacterized protein
MKCLLAFGLVALLSGCASESLKQDQPTVTNSIKTPEVKLTPDEKYKKSLTLLEAGSIDEANALFQDAADELSPELYYSLGLTLLSQGDKESAYAAFNTAAEQDHAESNYQIALIVENGDVPFISKYAAIKWYQKAAEHGVEKAKDKIESLLKNTSYERSVDVFDYYSVVSIYLGNILKNNKNISGEDIQSIASQLPNFDSFRLPKSDINNKNPLISIVYQLLFSDAMPSSKEMAPIVLDAELGNDIFYATLADIYEKHSYINKAIYWKGKEAEFGSPVEQLDFAYYLIDLGKYDRAFEFVKKAAQQNKDNNFTEADLKLAELYLYGNQEDKNPHLARKLLEKINDPYASEFLGEIYDQGLGVPVNHIKAANYYKSAAKQGVRRAQHNLASCYARGNGVPQDYTMSYVWYSVAVANGSTSSSRSRESVASKIPKNDLLAAQKIAAEYFEKYVVPFRS